MATDHWGRPVGNPDTPHGGTLPRLSRLIRMNIINENKSSAPFYGPDDVSEKLTGYREARDNGDMYEGMHQPAWRRHVASEVGRAFMNRHQIKQNVGLKELSWDVNRILEL